jgi:catechol 2,3-dioxygenase-like lactoylglutathione lyase family enzyme
MKLEFHHINIVSHDVDRVHDFYTRVLGLSDIPPVRFPRTEASADRGFAGKIRFATEGKVEFHLAERDLDVAFRNGQVINPVERGHIAFRTDDIAAVIRVLEENGIPYSDYGTAFAAEWHQVFFRDPEGTIVEVHQQVA